LRNAEESPGRIHGCLYGTSSIAGSEDFKIE
jgi:hypothetical protein